MVLNVTKTSQKMKNKSLLSIEQILQDEKKRFVVIIEKYFNLENFASLFCKLPPEI